MIEEIRMILFKMFLFICFCSSLNKESLMNFKSHGDEVSQFVDNLISDLSSEKPATSEVVLLRLGLYRNSKQVVDEIHASVATAVCKKNLMILPNLHEINEGE